MRHIATITLLLALMLGCSSNSNNNDENEEPKEEEKGNDKDKDKDKDPLDDFNNFPSSVIELDNRKDASTFRVVVIGNSIAYHAKSQSVGWNFDHGMAASSIDRDYVHLLFAAIEEALPDNRIRLGLYNAAAFERGFDDFDLATINGLREFTPHLVVVQIGENVTLTGDNTSSFIEKYTNLVNFLKGDNGPTVVCTYPFWNNVQKNNAIGQVITATGSLLADLSTLVAEDPENYAINETDYPGDKNVWLVDGVGIHPGDKGMRNIFEKIFTRVQESGCLDN